MHDAWKKRDLDKVFEIQDRLMLLHKALFVETSPAPVKYGAELLGQASAKPRLPLVESPHRRDQEAGARRHGACGTDQLRNCLVPRNVVIPSEARNLRAADQRSLAALGMTPKSGTTSTIDTRRLQVAKKPDLERTVVAQNRKARHNYFIQETFEAGRR